MMMLSDNIYKYLLFFNGICMYKSISNIRQEFLDFFESKNHQIIKSSSLVPDDDKTLLFTNSGMNQFKNIFLGIDKPLFKRVSTAQRCVRVGGKHNDLNNVGYTERHLTFFEMLGNFSFGDYFKQDAIQFAWELLTDSNCFNLSKDKIWITVHINDDESYDIWSRKVGVSSRRIIKIGNDKNDFSNSDNFWKMGNIGPCGPCSEIFYDRGDNISGFLPGNSKICGERYIEIWNLVFIQFNLQINGELLLLPMLSVDTGMGLERITSILQGVSSNYAIDVFKNLIISICQVMKVTNVTVSRSLYVIADHIRTCVFLIIDGVIPSNEGRGYVLRRIVRRAVLHGKKMGINNIFFCKLVNSVIISMRHITDFLSINKDYIEEILFKEEKLFAETLSKGLELLEKKLLKLSSGNILDGETVFNLYSTYGFPIELTKDICFDRNIKIDQIGFDKIMLKQKEYTRKISQFYESYDWILPCNVANVFVGYQKLEYQSQVIGLFQNNNSVDIISVQENGVVILKETPFYGESGGQIGDSGELKTESGAFFQVIYTKRYGQVIGHIGKMNCGILRKGDLVTAIVDRCKRKNICLNHSAHHLLRAALFETLGEHVIQKGSLINDQQLRFDFSHYEAMTIDQISTVENLVNHNIWSNVCILVDFMSLQKAKDSGAVMLLNKQYNEKELRVVRIGNFSVELCGGTHVARTGEIGFFIITKESSISSGIRRIEGVTGEMALSYVYHQKKLIQNISQVVHSDEKNLLSKIYKFKSNYRKLEREVENLTNNQVVQQSEFLIKEFFYIKDIQVLIKKFINMESKLLFNIVDYLKSRLKSGVIIIINYNKNNKIHLIVKTTKNLIENNRINALNIIHYIINIFGGKGGGQSDFAQAGIDIDEIKKISTLISKIDSFLRKML